MEKSTATTINKVVSVLEYIGGALMLISGLMAMTIGSAMGGGLMGMFGAFVGVILLVLGLLGIAVGYGLWTYRNWARILLLIGAALGVLGGLMGLFSGDMGSLLQLVISGVLIWLYGFRKEMTRLFK